MPDLVNYFKLNPTVFKIALSFALLLLNVIIIQLMSKVLFKTIKNNSTYYIARKRIYYTNTTVMLIVILLIWSQSKLDLTTYMGFISAGIAISLREIFTNIAAWFIIVFQKPFEVGDRITINNVSGDVLDVKLFQIVMMEVSSEEKGEQSTGRIVQIPNNYIFLHGMSNANKGFEFLWKEIEVHLTLDSNWEEAKRILEEMINHHTLHLSKEAEDKVYEASKKYMLHYQNLTPIVYLHVKPDLIVLTVRYLCEPRKGRVTENKFWQEVLKAFEEHEDILLK